MCNEWTICQSRPKLVKRKINVHKHCYDKGEKSRQLAEVGNNLRVRLHHTCDIEVATGKSDTPS